MFLEARAESCFSSTFVLKVDSRPHGKYEGRWFSEGLDIQMMGRRRLRLDNVRWLGSEFVLSEPADELQLGRAVRSGVFTRSWGLELSCGEALLEAAGLFSSAYVVKQAGEIVAHVDRLGACERGWQASDLGALNADDLLLVGLLYHVILQRQQHQHAGHAGS